MELATLMLLEWLTRDGAVLALLAISASTAGIDRFMWVLNPGKLGGLADAVT